MDNKFRISPDSLMNLLYITEAVDVTPSDTEELAVPGLIFLDNDSTEGLVKVELLNGGATVIDMPKNSIPYPYIVRKVFVDVTTATGIKLNRISQKGK